VEVEPVGIVQANVAYVYTFCVRGGRTPHRIQLARALYDVLRVRVRLRLPFRAFRRRGDRHCVEIALERARGGRGPLKRLYNTFNSLHHRTYTCIWCDSTN